LKSLKLVIVCFLFLAMQMVLAPRLALGRIAPDFLILLAAYIALQRGAVQGSLWGFAIGIIQDLFNPELFGLNALTKSLLGYGAGIAGAKTERDSTLVMLAVFFLGSIGHDFVYLLIYTGLDLVRFFVHLVTQSIPSAVYTALLGVLVPKAVALLGMKVVRSLGKARS
jgi:rod shape-determining protein MreD